MGLNVTRKCDEVLGDLYFHFSNRYMVNNPGCNENDIERAFLYAVYSGMLWGWGLESETTSGIQSRMIENAGLVKTTGLGDNVGRTLNEMIESIR